MNILSYSAQFSALSVFVLVLAYLILISLNRNKVSLRKSRFKLALLTALVFSVVPAQAQSEWVGWPSADENDGRFLAVTGPLSAIDYVAPNLIIGIPDDATQFDIELFDGDASQDLSSKYDINVSTSGYTYTLFQDPNRDGTGTDVEMTRTQAGFANDTWSSYVTSHGVSDFAKGQGGFYWYRLSLDFNGNPDTEQFFNALKVRVRSNSTSPASIGAFKEIIIGSSPFNPVLDPGLNSSDNTYDGDWVFNVRVTGGATPPLEFSDSDADFATDANAPGTPPDDNFARPEFLISPSIRYELFDPSGNLITLNTDPSGTSEEETFSYNPPVAAPAGLYKWHWFGVDASNVLILRTDFELLPVSYEKAASLGNYVWLDENGDGLQDAGEPGLAGVTVNLLDNFGDLVGTRVTDSNGGYLFNNLVPGTYTVEIDSNTLPVGVSQTLNPVLAGADLGNQSSPYTIDLSSGEVNLTADFGYSYGDPDGNQGTGALGDKVWIDSNGNGIQDAGEPGLGGVELTIYTDTSGDGIIDPAVDSPFNAAVDSEGHTGSGTTTTNADGSYIFSELPQDAYVVVVNPATLPAGYVQTADPDQFGEPATAADNQTTTPVVLAPGDVYLNVDFGYQPDTAVTNTIGDTVFLDTNANGIEDAGEPGVGDVTVSLLDGNGEVIATTTTDAAGQYLFIGLQDGDYSVVITDTNGILSDLSQSADPDSIVDGSSSLTVSGGVSNLDQDFGYTADAHNSTEGLIGDTVFVDRNLNGLPDEGEGLGSIKVQLYDVTGTALVAETYTNPDGLYLFGGLDPAASYTVKIDTTTIPSGLINTVDPDGSNDSQSLTNLSFTSNGINLDQDFGYVINSSDNTPGSIGDTVWLDSNADGINDGPLGADGIAGTDDDEPGIEGVTLDLYLDSNGDGQLQPSEPRVGSTVTDNTGQYLFDQLLSGDYIVDVSDDAGLLNGYWHSLGTVDTNDQSQSDPYAVSLPDGGAIVTADFGYYYELASVGDLVWFDANANGIQDAGEPGIADATVELTITYPDGSQTIMTTVTNSSGLYSFDNLLGDEDYNGDTNDGSGEPVLTIRVNAPSGLIASPVDQGSDDSVDSDNPQGELAQPVMGAMDDTNDFGFYDLGSISGNVSEDIDRDGNVEGPLSNVTVILYADEDRNGVADDLNGDGVINASDELGRDTTDAVGDYQFDNLSSGHYLVLEIDPDGYESIADNDVTVDVPADGTEIPNSQADDNLLPVSLVVDFDQLMVENDSGNNFVDAPILAGLGDTVWYDHNANGVQDSSESGIPNVTVNLLDSNGSVIDTTVTDSNGLYHFTDLLAGEYTVEIDPATLGLAQQQTYDLDDGTTTSPATPNSASVTLAAGDSNNDVDFGYRPLGSLGDTVWLDNNANGIVDAGESGIAGAQVSLSGTVTATTTTNADGEYEFTGLPIGSYTVTVSGSPLADLEQTHDLDDPTTVTPATANTANVDLVLSAIGDAVDSRDDVDFGYRQFGSISGTVTEDTDGDGAGDQLQQGVTIELHEDTDADGQPDTLVDTTITDVNGVYNFNDLSAGDYVVVEITPDGLTDVSDQDSTHDGDPFDGDTIVDDHIAVTLGSGEVDDGNDFADENAGSISGTVTEDTSGDGLGDTPQQGVVIELYEVDANGNFVGDPVASTISAADGSYTFENVSPGNYVLIEVQPAELSDVSDSDSTPEDGNDGNTPVDNLIPVSVQPGEADNDNNFVDQRFGQVGDFIWNDLNFDGIQNSGEPGIEGVMLSLYNANGQLLAMTTTASDGSYTFTGLPVGDYTVLVEENSLPLGFLQTYDLDGVVTEHTAVFTLASGEVRNDVDFGYAIPLQCNACVGKIDSLTLRYLGGETNANITVIQKDKNTVFDGLVQPDGQFSFVGTYRKGKQQATLGTEISVYINGQLNVTIHTSCSQLIGAGAVFGEFIVVHGTSSSGGQLCPWSQQILGSISGAVTEDTNGDGIGDAALAGVTVELYLDADADGLPDDFAIATTTTGSSGSYSFNDLNPSDYIVVEIDPVDYISIRDSASIDDDVVANINTNNNNIPVTVTNSENDNNNNFVDETSYKDPAIDIRKQQEGEDSRTFDIGNTVDFEIAVTNTGNVDLTSVVVSDPLVPACDNSIGLLEAGATLAYTCQYILQPASTASTTLFFDNFESNLGWVLNPEGNDTATTGHWEAADPDPVVYNGYELQPDSGYAGSPGNYKGLFTGPLIGSSAGTYDVDYGVTSIRSPSIFIPAQGQTALSLQYYLAHNSVANANDFLKIQIHDQSGVRYSLLNKQGINKYTSVNWTELTADLTGFSGQTIYLIIQASDGAEAGAIIEAGIDEIKITNTLPVEGESSFTNIANVSGETSRGQTVTDSDPSEVIVNEPVVCNNCVNGYKQMSLQVHNWSSNRDQNEIVRVREGGLGGTLLFEGQVANGASFNFNVNNPGATIVVTVQGDNHTSEYVKGSFMTDCTLQINDSSGTSYIAFRVTGLVGDGENGNCDIDPTSLPPVVTTMSSIDGNLCLDNLGSYTYSSVYKNNCDGSHNQDWELRQQGGYYEIVSAHSNLCLDVYNNSGSTSGEIGQLTCSQSANQLWEVQSYGSNYQIKSKSSGLCLEANTSWTYQYTCDGWSGQIWNVMLPQ